MRKQIRFAVVGAGHIGKRHAQVIENNSNAKLVAIADIDKQVRETVNVKFNVPTFDTIESLLVYARKEEVDVINICTPNGEHSSQTIQSLVNGFHVVCEKPLALSTGDCLKIMSTSNAQNKNVFCVMQNRYSPSAVWLKEVIEKGLLGNINMVLVNCLWNRDKRYYQSGKWRGTRNLDGGTLFTQFSHFIDTIYWLFGEVENIQARLFNFNHQDIIEFEDTGFVNFDFVKGGSCSFNYTTSAWDTNLESSIIVIGENGSIKVGGQYMNKVDYCHIKDYNMPELQPSLPPNDYGHYKGSAANHDFVIQNVIDTLTSEKSISTSVLEGMKVVEIIEKIYNYKS